MSASAHGSATYGSTELIRASEGVRFEVYFGEDKVLKGVFRKYEAEEEKWRMECGCCGLERDMEAFSAAAAAAVAVEVLVAAEGHAPMCERVELAALRRRKRKARGFRKLEEIPEEREEEEEDSVDVTEGRCSDCEEGGDSEGEEGGREEMMELWEMEGGVKWAVDVGIWVMCLGVGLLVSKASSKSLRRKRLL